VLVHRSVIEAVAVIRQSSAFAPVIAVVSEVGRRRAVATTACDLAQQFLFEDRSAAVVDCDFQAPVLHKIWERRVWPGLAEVLTGEREIDDIFDYRSLPTGRFVTVTAGGDTARRAHLLATEQVEETLRRLVDFAEIVLVNVGPLSAPHARSVVALCDGVIVVDDASRPVAAAREAAVFQGLQAPIMAWTPDTISTADEVVDPPPPSPDVVPGLPSWFEGEGLLPEPVGASGSLAVAVPVVVAGDTLVRPEPVVAIAPVHHEVPSVVVPTARIRDVAADAGDPYPGEFAIDNLWNPIPVVGRQSIPGATPIQPHPGRHDNAPKRKRRRRTRFRS